MLDVKIHILSLEQLKPNLWAGGSTYQYYLYPANSSYAEKDFLFRISSATIEQSPSVFTQFQGYTRYLSMLDNALDVTINGAAQHFEKQQIFLFDSNDTVVSTSLGTDFNWMIHKSIKQHHLEITKQSQQCNSPFILLFALEAVKITIQEQIYTLEKSSCIVIENPEKTTLRLKFDNPLIFMTLTI